jgi:hypothetical protein
VWLRARVSEAAGWRSLPSVADGGAEGGWYAVHAVAKPAPAYRPRRPQDSTLHAVVRDNLETLDDAGRVLVSVGGINEGSYRTAPTTKATWIIAGDAETLSCDARGRARASLRAAFFCGLLVLSGSAVAAILQALEEMAKSIM